MKSFIIFAYIDPVATAMLLQWIAAAIMGVGVLYRATIVRFFRFLFRREKKHTFSKSLPKKEDNASEHNGTSA